MFVKEIIPLDKRRCKVLLEEGFAFALYLGEIKKYRIEEGQELSQETYDEILYQILYRRARERVLHLLKSSDKTEQELRRKLREGSYPEEAICQAIEFAKNYRYVDDDGYTRRYVEYYKNSKSRRQILYDLKQKGIPQETAVDFLQENPVDELAQARKLLEKRRYDSREASPEERRKQAAYLARKGFPYEVIEAAVGRFDGR